MKFWALLALAASVAAIPLQGPAGRLHKRDEARKHIGYRVLSKAEAEAIHKNGGRAVQSTGEGVQQLGLGTYISPKFQLYKDFDERKGIPWDCVVTADANFWDGLKKAWVPKSFEFPEDKEENPDQCQPLPLWTKRWRPNRERWFKYMGITPEDTVLYSKVASAEQNMQALIPPDIIGTGKIYMTQCAERNTEANEQIGKMGDVHWDVEDLPGWGLGPGGL